MKRKSSYIEYIKNLIDVIHLWHAGKNTFIKNHHYKEKIYSIHIYDSIVVIEKRKITSPFDIKTGNYTVGYVNEKKRFFRKKIADAYYQSISGVRSLFYK